MRTMVKLDTSVNQNSTCSLSRISNFQDFLRSPGGELSTSWDPGSFTMPWYVITQVGDLREFRFLGSTICFSFSPPTKLEEVQCQQWLFCLVRIIIVIPKKTPCMFFFAFFHLSFNVFFFFFFLSSVSAAAISLRASVYSSPGLLCLVLQFSF